MRKILGNAEDQTRGCWVRSENAIRCVMHPFLPSSLFLPKSAKAFRGSKRIIFGHRTKSKRAWLGPFSVFRWGRNFFAEGHSGAECFSAKSKTLLEILFDGKQWWGWFLGWRLFLSSRYFWVLGEFNKTAEWPISMKWMDGAFRLENEWDAFSCVVTIFDRHSCWGLFHKTYRIPIFSKGRNLRRNLQVKFSP